MANEVTGTGDIVLPVNNVLMRGLLLSSKRVCPYMNGAKPAILKKHEGTFSAKWRRLERLAPKTTPLGEVTDSAYQNGRVASKPTVTDITGVMAKYGDFHEISEETDLSQDTPDNRDLVENLGEAGGRSLNILSRDKMDAETTGRFASSVAATANVNAPLSKNDIAFTVNALDRESAMKQHAINYGGSKVGSSPVRSSYFGITHVDNEEAIRNIQGFIPVEAYGSYTVTNIGEFGAVGGVRWSATEIASINAGGGAGGGAGVRETGGSADVYKSVIFGKEATGTVGFDKKFKGDIYMSDDEPSPIEIISKPSFDPFNETRTIAWKAWFLFMVLNSKWLKTIEHAAPSLD